MKTFMICCIHKLKANSQKLSMMPRSGNILISIQAEFTNFIHYTIRGLCSFGAVISTP
jgi:hypothetical protein